MAFLTSADRARRQDIRQAAALVGASVAGTKPIWTAGVLCVAVLVGLPVLAIGWVAAFPTEAIWDHLASTVLPGYMLTTALLLAGVGSGVAVIGTATAWLVAMCRFPARRVFAWALILPLAMPAYVVAYTYTDLLEFSGPVQSALRLALGVESARDYWFPTIRSTGGAVVMLSLVLYPYVYLMARAAFLEQSVCALEASRMLGRGVFQSLVSVALPLARPAIIAGVTLALLESLNDFGTVDYFAVRTLTAGVFDVWFGMGNAGGAAQIALVLLGFVILLISLERVSRRGRRFHATTTRRRLHPGYVLGGWRAGLAVLACLLPVLAGFAVPASVLLVHAARRFSQTDAASYWGYTANSFMLAASAAFIALVVGLFLAYAQRLRPSLLLRTLVRWASLGYAVPGAVIAIGVLISTGAFDNQVDSFMRRQFGHSTGLLIGGSIGALLLAYLVRFLSISLQAAEAGLAKVTPSIDMAARTLGHGPLPTLYRVHLPLIRGSVLTGAVLVFVDTMKELPATLVLRPFNFDTLATHVYQYASDEMLEACALSALTIVIAGILPVILLNRAISAGHEPGSVSP